jgi:hypothetical protein
VKLEVPMVAVADADAISSSPSLGVKSPDPGFDLNAPVRPLGLNSMDGSWGLSSEDVWTGLNSGALELGLNSLAVTLGLSSGTAKLGLNSGAAILRRLVAVVSGGGTGSVGPGDGGFAEVLEYHALPNTKGLALGLSESR